MADSETLLFSIKPIKIGLFGNPVTTVDIYSNGLKIERKNGVEEYAFADIEKITADGYADKKPRFIFISIHLKNAKKPIEFKLHRDMEDTNALLDSYSNFLLGDDFPNNLDALDLELGVLGSCYRLQGGKIVSEYGTIIPLSNVVSLSKGRNGFYKVKVKGMKHPLGISPREAPNIAASLAVLNEIISRNE